MRLQQAQHHRVREGSAVHIAELSRAARTAASWLATVLVLSVCASSGSIQTSGWPSDSM